MMNRRSFPVALPITWSLPILSSTQAFTSGSSTLTLISPSLPRLLISWSGFTTSFSVASHGFSTTS